MPFVTMSFRFLHVLTLPYRWIFDRPSGQPRMSWFPITNSQVCRNRTGTILMLYTLTTLHHLETKLMLNIHWENPSPLFTGLVTIYINIHLHAGYSFQRKYSSSSYLHYSITLNRNETVHIYLFLFTFFLREIIDIVLIQCKA